jgi:hypothetical protein
MLFYVKDRKTFKTKAVLEGVTWKLVRSVWTDLSEIVAKDDPNVNAGDIIFNRGGWLGLISDLERDGKQLSLKIEKIERILQKDSMAWLGKKSVCRVVPKLHGKHLVQKRTFCYSGR